MSARSPTENELLINEKIMDGCNHPEHTTETVREHGYDTEYLICIKCGERFYDHGVYDVEKGRKKPIDYLKKFVPLHCEDTVMARKLVRHLETVGFQPSMRIENGKYRYFFKKDRTTIKGDLKSSEHEAICSAATKLARQIP